MIRQIQKGAGISAEGDAWSSRREQHHIDRRPNALHLGEGDVTCCAANANTPPVCAEARAMITIAAFNKEEIRWRANPWQAFTGGERIFQVRSNAQMVNRWVNSKVHGLLVEGNSFWIGNLQTSRPKRAALDASPQRLSHVTGGHAPAPAQARGV